MRNYICKPNVTNHCTYAQLTLQKFMSSKDAELPSKATLYKLDLYIHLRLTLLRYIFTDVVCGLPNMRNYLCKAGLKQKIYKRQAGQRQKINCCLSAFVSLCFSSHFFPLFTFVLKKKGNPSNDQTSPSNN